MMMLHDLNILSLMKQLSVQQEYRHHMYASSVIIELHMDEDNGTCKGEECFHVKFFFNDW